MRSHSFFDSIFGCDFCAEGKGKEESEDREKVKGCAFASSTFPVDSMTPSYSKNLRDKDQKRGEYGHFEEGLREWKGFLDFRQEKEPRGKTGVKREERESVESLPQVDLWRGYYSHRQLEVENSKQWVEFWQRQVKHCQQEESDYARRERGRSVRRYRFIAERKRHCNCMQRTEYSKLDLQRRGWNG